MAEPSQGIRRASQVLPMVCDAAQASLDEIELQKDDPNHVHPVLLFASLFEFVFGIRVLASNLALAGIPVLLRSAVETYAVFLIVINDPNNYHYIHVAYVYEQSRFLKAAETAPELENVKELPDFTEKQTAVTRELNDYCEKGFSPLSIEKKFSKARLPGMYRSTYWYLSTEAHSNLMSLSNRHIRGDDEIEAIEVLSPIYHQSALEHIVVTIALLLEATKKFQSHFGINGNHGLDEALIEFEMLQKKFPPRE